MTNFKLYIIFVFLSTTCIYGRNLEEKSEPRMERADQLQGTENDGSGRSSIFMNQFALKIDGGAQIADEIASRHGFTNLGQIGSLQGYYLFEHPHVHKRSLEHSDEHHSLLDNEPQVTWFQQQVELKRRKRDATIGLEDLRNHPLTSASYLSQHFRASYYGYYFPDPLYEDQWYLHGGAVGGYDMNVIGAWRKGYTGKNVVVSILDDGIQTNHPDLVQNYDRYASTDINGNDDDPMPQDNGDNKHGTRCAGEVAATAYNGVCGVGVAYNASIGGVRMLDGTVNDAVEARALSHNPGHIDIYSASWGPEDDGKTVDGPGPLARQAFVDGVAKGRQGKGSIFVWASGNGGRHEDNCNCDGYTNSIYTLSISSATQHGLKPWYLEECSSTLATTYSSGTPGRDQSIVTVDMDMTQHSEAMCTKEHTGTSASAPIAAAICALAMEANHRLTWRDMQYLVVLTSKPEPLERDGWVTNGVGRQVSHKFGYGLMDAEAMVTLAERWTPVPPQRICEMPPDSVERMVPNECGASVDFFLDTDGCFGTHRAVNFLEHVQAKISLTFAPRGNLRIVLQSPSGTSSTLLFPRPQDMYKTTFDDWPFLSVHFWGERPVGRWRLTVINVCSKAVLQPGVLKRWSLVFYGTEEDPLRPDRSDPSPTFAASSISVSSVLPPVQAQGAPSTELKANMTKKPSSNSGVAASLQKCHQECFGGCFGDGASQCRACRHLSLRSGSKKLCVHQCPDGHYAVPDRECHQCHSSCATCSGGSSQDCLTCNPTHFLLREGDAIRCRKQCPIGYFIAPGSACNPCSSQCVSCADVPDKCIQCHEGLVRHGNKCLTSCPKHTYNSNEDGRCEECHSSCDTCVGPKATDCVTCPKGLYHSEGSCLPACPGGHYHPDGSNECYSCHPNCKTCSGNQCSSCWKGWTLGSDGLCSPLINEELGMECVPGKYAKYDKCLPCHVSCQTCFGPSFSQCTSCPNNRFLHLRMCVDKCPKRHFTDDQGICLPCHDTCAACTGPTDHQCTSCKKGLRWKSGRCTNGCPERHFRQKDQNQCMPCHASCSSCKNATKLSCTGCVDEGLILVQGTCQEPCALGYFLQNEHCAPCHPTCATCKGDGPLDCLSCPENQVLDGGICMICGRDEYYNPRTKSCGTCHGSCLSCHGPDAFSCTACSPPLKYDPLLQRCVPCCPGALDTDCCHCDQLTATCVVAPVTNKRRTEVDAMHVTVTFQEPRGPKDAEMSPLTKNLLVGSCIFVLVLGVATVGILKAKLVQRWCFTSTGYQPVPTQYGHLSEEKRTSTRAPVDVDEEEEEDDDGHEDTNALLSMNT